MEPSKYRPWYDFDGKTFLAMLFFAGYYLMFFKVAGMGKIDPEIADIIKSQMLILGPAIGVIVGATWRTTAADERRDERRSDEVKTAITTPTPALALPPPDPSVTAEAVRSGAEEGSRAGVADGMSEAAADPLAPTAAPLAWEKQ